MPCQALVANSLYNKYALAYDRLMNPSPIYRAAIIAGNQSKLAAKLGVSRQFIHQLLMDQRPIPAKLVLKIEAITGGIVTRHELRPDVFGKESQAA